MGRARGRAAPGRRAARAGLALAAALAAAPARGDPPAPSRLEALLPPDTLAFAAVVGGGRGLLDRARAAGLSAWLDDPEVRAATPAFAAALRAALAAAIDLDRAGPGVLPERAAAVLEAFGSVEGEAAVALVPRPGGGRPRIAALLDFGGALRAFQRFAAHLEAAGDADGVRLRREAGASDVWTLDVPGGAGGLEVRVTGSSLLLSDDLAGLREALGAGPPLAEAPAFRAAREDAGADGASFFAWAPVLAALPGEVAGPLADGARDALEVLRRAGVRGAAAASVTTSEGTRDRVVLYADGGAGAPFAALAPPRPARDAAGAPFPGHGPLVRAETPLSPGGLARALGSLSVDVAAAWDRAVAGGEAAPAPGTSFEDLVPRFRGGTAAWLAVSQDGGLVPEAGLAAGVEDPRAAEAAFAAATGALAARLAEGGTPVVARTIPFDGTTLHVLEFEGPALAPSWCVADGLFLLAPSPHALRAILGRRGGGLGPPLAPGDATLVVEADLARVLATAWGTAAPLASLLAPAPPGAEGSRLDAALLPASRTMARLWGGATARLAVADGRLVLEVRHRWPVLPLLAGGAALAWAARAAEARAPAAPPRQAVTEGAEDPAAATRHAMDEVASAAREYAVLEGALPARAKDLVERERLLASVPTDGWGRPLAWTRDPASGEGEVRSAGPDGVLRTADDLVLRVAAP